MCKAEPVTSTVDWKRESVYLEEYWFLDENDGVSKTNLIRCPVYFKSPQLAGMAFIP
ncbi:MAG: hypothetical protein G3M70_08295 [Candidatus Nitronauta litoralis]|uniref:Uncharacterized protein n=1 Tax=Candidatus Nitronauta litoralis TaxID=2705533 RepID=A0A7T0BVS5_9BACT|nr:MAG: hypothetical protein G3M70_08295 [Candidatus Nitronauta litoralis]